MYVRHIGLVLIGDDQESLSDAVERHRKTVSRNILVRIKTANFYREAKNNADTFTHAGRHIGKTMRRAARPSSFLKNKLNI